MRRAAAVLVLASLLAGCGFLPRPPAATTSPSGAASLSPSPTPVASADAASEDPQPTPGGSAVPRFAIGSLVATNAPGLRIRSRPGTSQRVLITLGLGVELVVGMGPILVDDLGWYLVRDAAAQPAFDEGWVAAGFEPDPFLVSTGRNPDRSPYLDGFAGTTPGELGPISLPQSRVVLRWIASAGNLELCNFALDVSGEAGDPVRAVRTPVGAFPASGELPYRFLRANDLDGARVYLQVESNCSWAVSFVRVEASPSPSPSPS
jgi:hypothetical protein